MSYAVAHLDEIDELDDGRCPWRPVRHHFGITAFGINAWTARGAGDRIINEHDESEPDANEELYLVQRGRAVFELDGERLDAPAGTLVFVRSGVRRTAFAEEAGRRSSRSAASRERRTSPSAGRCGLHSDPSTRPVSTPRRPTAGAS
jgi:hypothetical protein